MKKIIAIAIALTVSVLLVGPGVAQGATVEELQAQIATLTAQLAALQTQLAGLGGTTTVPAACAGITSFTRSLTIGSTGTDVKCLQALLNTSADTQVAASGVGSLGNETLYFGALTQAAVAKYQTKNAISPAAGYFGPITRAKINPTLVGGVVTPPATCGNGTCGTGETNANCPADCPATTGKEGGILGTINSAPASGAEVYINTTGKAIAAIDVKAIGDVVVNRLDLNFSKRPWLYISNVTVTDGTTSKTLPVTQAGTSEVTVGSSYLFRIDGLNISIPANTTKTLTVKVDSVSALPGTETSTDVILTFAAECVRATDGAGILQYAPTAALATRTFTMKEGDTAALEITANADNPKDRPQIVSDTAQTSGVTLAKIDVKAKNKDAILRTLEVTDDASGTISVLYLYDGDTLLSSTSSLTTAASSTLSNINLTIAKDTTKTLTLKADLYKTDGKYAEGASTTMLVYANVSSFSAEDGTTFATATVSGSSVTSGTAYLYTKAPTLALVSTETNNTVGNTSASTSIAAQAKVKVNVTASGGDIYIPVYDAVVASNGIMATSSPSTGNAASTTLTQTFTSNADYGDANNTTWVVRSNTTKWFEVVGNFDMCTILGQTHFDQLKLEYVRWGTTVAAAEQPANNQTWGLTDFKTSQFNLNICQ